MTLLDSVYKEVDALIAIKKRIYETNTSLIVNINIGEVKPNFDHKTLLTLQKIDEAIEYYYRVSGDLILKGIDY